MANAFYDQIEITPVGYGRNMKMESNAFTEHTLILCIIVKWNISLLFVCLFDGV